MGWLDRTALIFGEENMALLAQKRVAILGLGGVGGSAAEAVCRSGVGSMLLVDHDCFDDTNRNRQLLSTSENVGLSKVVEARKRLLSINPLLELTTAAQFYLPENSGFLFDYRPDYVIDCIDTVTAKLHLIEACAKRNIPLVTCFGTGNRIDPSLLRHGDVYETGGSGCPIARIMRRELKKRGILRCEAVYSVEVPLKAIASSENGRHSPASAAFVPPAAGYLAASVAVRRMLAL